MATSSFACLHRRSEYEKVTATATFGVTGTAVCQICRKTMAEWSQYPALQAASEG